MSGVVDGKLSAALHAARDGFGLAVEHLEPVDPRQGGTTHSTFQLLCGGERYFLKGYALGDLGRAELEARLLLHLAAHPSPAYRTPTPLRAAGGGVLHRADRPGPFGWLATRWLAGEKRSWHDFSEADWRALGAALAALHGALAEVPAPGLGAAAPPSIVRRLRAVDPAQEQDRLVEHAAQALRRRDVPAGARRYFAGRQRILEAATRRLLDLRRAAPEPPGPSAQPALSEQLLHNDFNQYNFLFAEGLPVAVLDWERACLGPAEYEVVRCINVACLSYPERAAAFLDAYAATRPLSLAGLRFGVAAFLLEQAAKHWPVAAWLDGRDLGGHFEGQFEVVELLSAGLPGYARFYAALGA